MDSLYEEVLSTCSFLSNCNMSYEARAEELLETITNTISKLEQTDPLIDHLRAAKNKLELALRENEDTAEFYHSALRTIYGNVTDYDYS